MTERFSDRYSYSAPEVDIALREDAPTELREAILMMAKNQGMTPTTMRDSVCGVLEKLPDPGNWTDYPNVWYEVVELISGCHWYEVYEIAEDLHTTLNKKSLEKAQAFSERLNRFFREKGIGWEMREGQIVFRGESFTSSTSEAVMALEESGRPSAASEIREAIRDISRRPDPDVTGAIQHSMAALEATAREVTSKPNQTLGQLVGSLDLPAPLDGAVDKLWGYTSQYGRHGSEVKVPDVHDAELVVSVAAALCTFLAHKEQSEDSSA